MTTAPIVWMRSEAPVPYLEAVAAMEGRAAEIAARRAEEMIWLLEHPPLYTSGPRAKPEHLVIPDRFPVFETGRGGELTYHGPGQRIAYVMVDVAHRLKGDIRAFVSVLENSVIDTLDSLGIPAWSDPARPGVWVKDETAPAGEAKIAALGLRVRRGVSFHGLSLNIAPDLTHFDGIVACGLEGSAVTSLARLGIAGETERIDALLIAALERRLGVVTEAGDQERLPFP